LLSTGWEGLEPIPPKIQKEDCTEIVISAGHWWLMPVILPTWETEIWRIMFPGQPRQIVREIPAPKSPEQNGTGGVIQVIECLLCKLKALSSKPSPTKKKKKKKRERKRVCDLCILFSIKRNRTPWTNG
jgi:hypothetical protein